MKEEAERERETMSVNVIFGDREKIPISICYDRDVEIRHDLRGFE